MEALFAEVLRGDAPVGLAPAGEQERLEPEAANLVVEVQAGLDGQRLAPLHPLAERVVVEQFEPARGAKIKRARESRQVNNHPRRLTLKKRFAPGKRTAFFLHEDRNIISWRWS
jgi:hypothetical protein